MSTNTSKAAAALGRVSTPAKAAAARQNGQKGGRPARNAIYLVRSRLGLKNLDYGFGAEKDQHVPVAGQVGPNGEPLSASEAKYMRSRLPAGWGSGSTFALQGAGVRVAPGDVEILAKYAYEKGGYGVEIIGGERLEWKTRGVMDSAYETADGRRFPDLLAYLYFRAGLAS